MKKILFLFLVLCTPGFAFSQHQKVDTIRISSKIFNSNRKIKVALPEGYEDNPDKKYIVAYLFDAQSEDFFNFYKSTIDYLTKQGLIQPVILVGIASENRQYEFTPQAQTPQGLKKFAKSGGASLLAAHLKDEVMPLIKEKYRSRNYNIGMGHSLGGTFVTYSLFNAPELFNAAIAISPNLQYDELQVVRQFENLKNPKLLDHKYYYLAHGNGDAYEDSFKIGIKKVDSILQVKAFPGFRWKYKDFDNDSHGTTAMEGMFKGLIDVFRQFSLSDKQINAFYADDKKPFIDQVKDVYQAASDWSGLRLPVVDDLNTMGYNCYYANKKQEAVEVFQWGLTLYPENINLYDSIGEVLQLSGNKEEALKYYRKGITVIEKRKGTLETKKYNKLISGFEERIKSLGNL